MCRFTFYRGEPLPLSALLTTPENSLIHQSTHARERVEPLNGDGFGVSWYVRGEKKPGLFRSIAPAWSNQNLRSLARVVRSGCVLAHVRAASEGLEVMETNCHPFKRGRYAFMHNGAIGGFRELRRPLQATLSDESFRALRGTTDSEHVFSIFMDELRSLKRKTGCEALATALNRAVVRVTEIAGRYTPGAGSRLNLLVSDGRDAVACRFVSGDAKPESLYVSHGKRYLCEDGFCRMVEAEEGKGARAVLVSSEPLYDSDKWEEVPLNHLVKVHAELGIDVEPMA